ncbi:MAG: hypothetical protein P8127_07535, partial [Acidobacteriota bacterium]
MQSQVACGYARTSGFCLILRVENIARRADRDSIPPWVGLRNGRGEENMSREKRIEFMWTRVLIRPAQVIVAVMLGGCLIAIIGLSLLAVQARSRLHTMRERGDHTNRMLRLGLQAQESLLEHPGDQEVVDPVIIEELRQELAKLRTSGRALDPANDERLLRLTEILGSADEVSRDRLIEIVATMGNVLRTESTAQNSLWDATERAA